MISLNITPVALRKLLDARLSDGLTADYNVRISVKGGGCSGFQNELAFDNLSDEEDGLIEFAIEQQKISVVIDCFSSMYMNGVTLDYTIEDFQEGFKFVGGSADRRHCACGSSYSDGRAS
jgi:iron-sulfur cluster assembly protein